LTGDDSVVVGNNLKSETVDVNPVWCFHPKSGKEVILLDTPGFADTERTDTDILLTIANWLNATSVLTVIGQ
jgi:predicted GTPase